MNALELLVHAVRFAFPYTKNPSEMVFIEKIFNEGGDYWTIKLGGSRWSKKHQMFIYEPCPSERTDEFIEDTKYNLNEAYGIANTRNLIEEHRNKMEEYANMITDWEFESYMKEIEEREKSIESTQK